MRENTTGLNKGCLLDWNLDETGCLTIYGSGSMPDFSCGKNPVPPWQEKKTRIQELYVSEGITEIGVKAFEGCHALRRVYLPDSLKRIHAYAFRDCFSLEEVRSKKNIFRYIYDENPGSARETVYFGLETFKNTPWASDRWGDFYCEEGVLYICFSQKHELAIPKGVHTLHKFSLAGLGNCSVTLPETLTTIEEFAFFRSGIKELILPENIKKISPYAFADSSLEVIEFPAGMKKTERFFGSERIMPVCDEKKSVKKGKLCTIPALYRVNMETRRNYGKFKELKVMRKKTVHHKDGTVDLIYGRNHVAVGESLYKRIQSGKVLICVRWRKEGDVCVRSFYGADDGKGGLKPDLVCGYQVDPVLNDGETEAWRDSFSYQCREEFVKSFPESDGKMLAEESRLRRVGEGVQEVWFCSGDRENSGGPLELKFLEYWMQEYPQVPVESLEEKRKRFVCFE